MLEITDRWRGSMILDPQSKYPGQNIAKINIPGQNILNN